MTITLSRPIRINGTEISGVQSLSADMEADLIARGSALPLDLAPGVSRPYANHAAEHEGLNLVAMLSYAPVLHLSSYPRRGTETDDGPRLHRALSAVPEGGALYLGGLSEVITVRTAEGFVDRCVNLTGYSDRGLFGQATIRIADDVPVGRTLMRGTFHRTNFYGFTLDGNVDGRFPGAGVEIYGAESEGYNLKQCTQVNAYYLTAKNMHQDGFDTDGCIDCLLYRCRAIDNWGEGYHLTGEGGAHDNYCWNCMAVECYSENNGHMRRASGDPYGNGYSTSGSGNYIVNCKSVGDARGIYVGAVECKIFGNTIIDPGTEDGLTGEAGIIIKEPARGALIEGNTVVNASALTGSVGIKAEAPNNIIKGNYVKNAVSGIWIAANNTTASNNTVNTATNGVLVDGNTDWSYARDNTLLSCQYGVRTNSAKVSIKGNIIKSPSSHAIELRAGEANVTGNEVYGGFGWGVRGFDSTVNTCIIKDNILNAASGGISMHVSSTGHVQKDNVVNGAHVP